MYLGAYLIKFPFYFGVSIGIFIADTFLVWVQDNVGWHIGLFVPTLWALLLLFSFSKLSSIDFRKPRGCPFTRMCQVLVAAFHKWNLGVPKDSSLLFKSRDRSSAIDGSCNLEHTDTLK